MSKGRPISWIWSYFNRKEELDGNRKLAFFGYCAFCDERYQTNPARMEKHLQSCKKVGVEARKQIDQKFKKPGANSGESPQHKKARISMLDTAISSQASPGTIKNWFDSTSNHDQYELDILLTRAFATGNIAPNFLDNPFFKQFVSKLRPSYKLPGRQHKFAKVLIPAEFERVRKEVEDTTNKADFLAISSDGWTDVRSNSIINLVVHTPKPFLWNSIDATAEEVDGIVQRIAHTGQFIADVLSEEIECLSKNKIVAVVTDHAANMKNAWKLLADKYPWMLFEGCKAHMINLAAKDIAEKTKIADCLKHCSSIAKFFRKKTPELIFAKCQVEEKGSSQVLQLPVKTRWGTYAKLVSSIATNEVSLKSAIWSPGIEKDRTLKDEAGRIKQILLTDDFWLDVKDVKEILSPLAEVITAIEGDEVDSRKCYKMIKQAFSFSRAAIENSEFLQDLKEELIEIVDKREDFGTTDVAHLLDVLEPSDLGESLKQEEKQAAIELFANKCLKNPLFAGQEERVMTEWAHWLAGTGIFARDKRGYAWDALNTIDGLTWWKAFFSDCLLFKVVQMLHNVPMTAAPTERNWSLRKGIHTKLRNRMNVDMASQLTFIKHNLMLEHAHLFKPTRKENQMEEQMEEEQAEERIEEHVFDENYGDLFEFD